MTARARVLITGTGMVGCYSAAALLEQEWDVTLLDRAVNLEYVSEILGDLSRVDMIECDITDRRRLREIFESFDGELSAVVHTAALVSRRAQNDICEAVDVNVVGTMNVAGLAADVGARRLVFCSTMGVYAEDQPGPITEKSPLAAEFELYYSASKLVAETLLGALAATSNLEVVALRPAVLYGHGTHAGGGVGSAALEAVLREALQTGSATVPIGQLGQTEWVYVTDVARAVAASCSASVRGNTSLYNIGSGRVTSMAELLEAIREVLPGVALTQDRSETGVTTPWREYALVVDAAVKDLGYGAPLGLREGLAQFVNILRGYRVSEAGVTELSEKP
jgi:nucleoside-diphosphate-sugar epimerase